MPGQVAAVRVDAQVGAGRPAPPASAPRRRPCRRCRRGARHHDVEPGAGGVQRGGQAGRAAAGDHEVTARPPPWLRGQRGQRGVLAPGSGPSSSAALATVKTSAVIQAACTSGSAMPSTTTAT